MDLFKKLFCSVDQRKSIDTVQPERFNIVEETALRDVDENIRSSDISKIKNDKRSITLTPFAINGTMSKTNNRYENEDFEGEREARIKARFDKAKYHEKEHARAQTSCSVNSYIKPKNLMNLSVDYSTFERFQKIKSQIQENAVKKYFICQEIQTHHWIP